MVNQILIIEDSEIVSLHLKKVLEQANYQVMAILTSGEEAIEHILHSTPDLVIMDVMLEGKYDGIETSIEINKIKDIPVIYLTAFNDRDTYNRAKITFPYTILSKPFSETELLSNVELSLFKHKIEKQKKESEKLLTTILSNIKSCMVVIDSTYKIRYVNSFTEALLNTPSAQILQKQVGNQIVVVDSSGEPLSAAELVKEGHGREFDIFFLHFNGEEYPINNISVSRARFLDEDDEEFLLMFNDGSESFIRQEKEKSEKRQKLAAQIEGIETERSRVSRELHDGLGQMLNVIKMNVKTLISESSTREKLITLIEASIEESHKISEDLMPSKLKFFDLKSSLEDLCLEYQFDDLNVDFSTNLLEGELGDIKINIFRIVQEALSNIQKHAHARNVSIQFYRKETEILLTIEDDGIGFDINEVTKLVVENKSHGLINIMDRVKAMEGEIEIDSNAQFGTNIIIHLNPNTQYA